MAPARPNSARPNGGGFAPVQTAPSGSGSNVGTGSRPLRQSAASPSRPEFDEGFPEGFTRGLPTFDFQGRMPGECLSRIPEESLKNHFEYVNHLIECLNRTGFD